MKNKFFQQKKLFTQVWKLLFIFLCCFPSISFCQKILSDGTTEIDENVELNFKNSDANTNQDYTSLFETLQDYKKNKLNLNTATANDLSNLHLLNSLQISNLLKHIRDDGLLINLCELQTINGFSNDEIQKILPYVRLDNMNKATSFPIKNIFKNGTSKWTSGFQQTLEKSKGYLINGKSSYLGSPQKYFSRYRFHSANFSAGFEGEKDAGEEFFRGSEKQGFDYYSGYLELKNDRFIKNIIVGDYQASFGQGLTTWTGFGFGKSSDIMNIAKSENGFRQHTSYDEINYFRGIATSIALNNFTVNAFVSDKKTDANIITAPDTNYSFEATSLQQSGLHRTISELANKNSLQEKVFGGNITYSKNDLTLGITALTTHFNNFFQKKQILYNDFYFSGKMNINAGINYGYSFRNFYFFGETAISKNGGTAILNGFLASLSPNFSLTFLQRNYARNYQNFFSDGFSESTSTSNEKGIYIGIEMHPFSKFHFSAYSDYFKFPWLKYLVDAPSYGNDFLENMSYSLSPSIKLKIKMRQHTRFKNAPNTGLTKGILPVVQHNYRFQIQYNATNFIELINRLEYVNYKQKNATPSVGFLISQTIFFRKKNAPLSISINYTLFQTDDYNSRIYLLENDFYNRYTISDFFYKGLATSISAKYKLSKKIIFSLRATQLFYQNKNSVGSGNDEISGDTKNTVAAQIQFSF